MASELDVLLDKVADPTLRADLKRQVELLRAKRRFGLVFEEHLPERVRLPEHSVRRGTRVVLRDHDHDEPHEVVDVRRGKATVRTVDGDMQTVAVEDLVVVADFGEPIYPGLRRLGSLRAGGDKPAHVVIKGENYHVLEALQFTHAGKIDCIYIDPPYNSGARDWKYNNDYVDSDDSYRHSKWLAFMHRRLRLAKSLLNPECSVLIVTIDEKEFLRLGLLLQQLFADTKVQMVSSVVNRKGVPRKQGFARVDEYLLFVYIGDVGQAVHSNDMLSDPRPTEVSSNGLVSWVGLRRRGSEWRRSDRPGSFFPIYVDTQFGQICGAGESLPLGVDRSTVPEREGCLTVWPLNSKGEESRWQLSPDNVLQLRAQGLLRSYFQKGGRTVTIEYLSEGQRQQIQEGQIVVDGRDEHGAVTVRHVGSKVQQAKSVWNLDAHGATAYGTQLVSALLPGRSFPYPKSLYAVEDTIRFFVHGKPDAVVLDFFGGSGTTTHALARLNRQDGGRRQSILVTNNEVSVEEARSLRSRGYRPGDPEWEALGIFEHITRPRITAAITGVTHEGERLNGSYRFVDEFPMSEGLDENVEFFELTYLDPEDIEVSAAFTGLAPLLWLRAGGRGEMIEHDAPHHAVMDTYGVLFNPDHWRSFVSSLHDGVRTVFIVTDSPSIFAAIVSELPASVEAVRLYENYLSTFGLNTRKMVTIEAEPE